jgi:hypothetical protein
MEGLLLLSIANKTASVMGLFNLASQPSYVAQYLKRAPIEAFKIFPHYPFMKFVMYVLFAPLKPALSGLDGKVSFLNIGESNDVTGALFVMASSKRQGRTSAEVLIYPRWLTLSA